MKDREFKILKHYCKEYTVYSSGKNIEPNYSPDFVLKCDNSFLIFEHETEPNRKTIIANIYKAAYFLQNDRKGKLIIVMTPKRGSSLISYPKHVLKYYDWLKTRTNLENVIFIHQENYVYNQIVQSINDNHFLKNSISLNSLEN
jgi:hypothetical protein